MRTQLLVPGVLLVCVAGTVQLTACTNNNTSDAATVNDVLMDTVVPVDVASTEVIDAAVTDVVADVISADGDACPDPLACYGELRANDAGGADFYYRRSDGSVTDVPCPPAPPNCPVV